MRLTVSVNGTEYSRDVEPRLLLIHFLRDELGLTGSHWGCDTSNCGACVVWLDEVPVKSCTVLAVMADGRRVLTVEGLGRDGQLDPVQQGFAACHGLQCGFCTPGMMLTARWLLDNVPAADRRRDPGGDLRVRSAGAPATRTSSGRCSGPARRNLDERESERAGGAAPRSAPRAEREVQHGVRADPAQGRRAAHPRPGHVRRRPAAAGHAARGDPAQSVRARPDPVRRRQRGAGAPHGRGRADRGRPGGAGPGLDADAVWRRAGRARDRQGAGSRARRSRSSSRGTGTRPGMRWS